MSHIDFQIFTRNPASSKEQEPSISWTEHQKGFRDFYDTDIPLWQPEGGKEHEGVYFDFQTGPGGGIGILSNGEAEVFSDGMGLIVRDKPITTGPVTIINDRAYTEGSRAEIFFHYGAILGLTIKVNGQPVKEVKIVGEIAE